MFLLTLAWLSVPASAFPTAKMTPDRTPDRTPDPDPDRPLVATMHALLSDHHRYEDLCRARKQLMVEIGPDEHADSDSDSESRRIRAILEASCSPASSTDGSTLRMIDDDRGDGGDLLLPERVALEEVEGEGEKGGGPPGGDEGRARIRDGPKTKLTKLFVFTSLGVVGGVVALALSVFYGIRSCVRAVTKKRKSTGGHEGAARASGRKKPKEEAEVDS